MWCCCCVMVFTRCANSPRTDSPQKEAQTETPAVPVAIDYAASTTKMATLIARSFANIDPAKAPFQVDKRRLEYFRQQGNDPDAIARFTAWIYYANELLNVGNTEQAIIELETILKELGQIKIADDTLLLIHRLLAIAYLRLGEEANCINARNHASCILPLSPEGQYRMTTGSETAMKLCIDILNKFPGDDETIWLLNLAAMTIGKYPKGVPAKWRIPEASIMGGLRFTKFNDISQKVGIKGASLAGGACVEDFDGDGWLDIITSSLGGKDPLVYWKNTGQGTFTDASAGMGLKGINGGLNLLHADINNDGLADILVLRGAWLRDQGKIPNSLLLNLGNGKFADITNHAGVLTFAATQTAAFADFNLDGYIDFFVGNESGTGYHFPNEFYLNNKNNTFRNVITKIGASTGGYIKGCVAGDVNNDGWPDIYISLLPGKNMLLLNTGLNSEGIPQFENISDPAGVGEPIKSFPVWMWDFNNDGWEDIFVTAYGDDIGTPAARDFVLNAKGQKLNSHPRVYRNNGNNTFADVTTAMGMTENIYTMGCNYGDLDADGYLDFYLGTGTPEYSSVVPNKMFRNNAGKTFDDITASGGFGHIQKGHAVAFGDMDRDGDEDIFESLGGAFDGDVYEDILFENPIGQEKSWIVLQLQGVQSNRMAIGARVRVSVQLPNGKHNFYRTVSTGGSFGSSSLQLEIGLDNATAIQEIEIIWPVRARTKQIFRDVQLNTYVRITEGIDITEYPDVHPTDFE